MDTGEAVKKYWPWVLGGVAGLYVLSKMSGGGGGDSGAAYAQMMQAQMAAGLQNQQAAAQQAAQQAQIKAQYDIAAMNRDVALAQTAAAVQKSDNETAVQFIMANAQLAQGAGSAATGIISALNMPAVAAINAMSNENAAALQSAALISMGAFAAQASMVNKAIESTSGLGSRLPFSPWGANSAIISSNQSGAQSVSAGAGSTGQTTQAISQSNAQGNSAMFGMFGDIFSAPFK